MQRECAERAPEETKRLAYGRSALLHYLTRCAILAGLVRAERERKAVLEALKSRLGSSSATEARICRAVGRKPGWLRNRIWRGDIRLGDLLKALEVLGIDAGRFFAEALDRVTPEDAVANAVRRRFETLSEKEDGGTGS